MHSYYHHTGRRVFFWSLALLYICLISIIIPYAFGYRFSFERGVFIYAGSVTVKANPRSVDIAIDGDSDTNPTYINNTYHISGISPGTHNIEISANGFRSLHKEITVSSGISTELWNIILPRIEYPRTQIANIATPYFYRAPSAPRIVYSSTDKNGVFSVSVIDTSEENTSPPLHITPRVPQNTTHRTEQNIEWSVNSTALIVPITLHDESNATSIEDALIITTEQNRTLSLRSLFPSATDIGSVRWSPQEDRTFYVRIDNTLTEIILPEDLSAISDVRTRIIANDVRSYTISENTIYYLTQRTGIIHKVMRDGTAQVTTTPTSLASSEPINITVYDSDRIILRGIYSGALELFDAQDSTTPRILSHGIRGTHFSDDGKKLLYWNTNEIFVYFLRSWDVQPFRTAGETLAIARFSTPIHNVQWAHDYEHVLYTTDTSLKLTSLDDRGGRTTYTLLSLTPQGTVRSDYFARQIYLTDSDEDGIYSLERIDFPEKDTRF